MSAKPTCPQCGAELPPDAPQGLCPRCVIKVGLGSQPEDTLASPAAEQPRRRLPEPGEQFGGYRIVQTLGRGGMGAVYEAEHFESGRRVALKVLSHQLDSVEARRRFLREGRLAASINHPNSVYVYGTEEIGETPVISMELVPGGTLQERVQKSGPLPYRAAVDAILQIITGLEAAQAIGILHRDVKPANCFVDIDGTVKIGDFGLSISTAPRNESELTIHGMFLGTPAFASPEQLRGDELNARSDLYSVGVTLFYLLTGRAPFQSDNMVKLLATVLEQPAPSPAEFQPRLPRGLCAVVQRCLAKDPMERFRDYDELRKALRPYSSQAPTAATLGLRLVAGTIDLVFLSAFFSIVQLLLVGDLTTYLNPLTYTSPKLLMMATGSFVAWLLYYAVLEGRWGASLGKGICGLRVVDADKSSPRIFRALGRALLFLAPPALPYWIYFALDPGLAVLGEGGWVRHVMLYSYYGIIALIFCTARRRNGYAALHDMLTSTRVIRIEKQHLRPVLESQTSPAVAPETLAMVGPYHVIETLARGVDEEWLLGYDTRLLRKVWLRLLPAGTPPVSPHLRQLSRPGRLRWLSGQRSADKNWDAYEGISGKPLLALGQERSWAEVRFWLLDLAEELNAASKDHTLPPILGLDRIWITGDGRLKLLDFPAPGMPGPASLPPAKTSAPLNTTPAELASFVQRVADAALGITEPATKPNTAVGKVPLPLHARAFLKEVARCGKLEEVVAGLKPLLNKRASVSRLHRALVVVICAGVPVAAMAAALLGTLIVERTQQAYPAISEINGVLQHWSVLNSSWLGSRRLTNDRPFAIFIAAHYRSTITNQSFWESAFARAIIAGDKRAFAERAVREYPNPSSEELAMADEQLKPIVEVTRAWSLREKPETLLLIGGASLLIYVAFPAVLAALLFRGGLVLLLTGIAIVRADGNRASRGRTFVRSLVLWAPAFFVPILLASQRQNIGASVIGWWIIAGLLYGAVVVFSLLLPRRGLHDRIMGTWLVPR